MTTQHFRCPLCGPDPSPREASPFREKGPTGKETALETGRPGSQGCRGPETPRESAGCPSRQASLQGSGPSGLSALTPGHGQGCIDGYVWTHFPSSACSPQFLTETPSLREVAVCPGGPGPGAAAVAGTEGGPTGQRRDPRPLPASPLQPAEALWPGLPSLRRRRRPRDDGGRQDRETGQLWSRFTC